MVSKPILFSKFRALCTCGTRLTSARRLSRLGFGFWGVTGGQDHGIHMLEVSSKSRQLNFRT
ncbi:hypothetical protein SLEP1_g12633 [Rubroshorea leprosula]|uniref:Uncharacterized protein n=1 Tax=Rubroshorea leprosula TaxID=152421 RepID=A0AAV5INB7_9ROSI|nr:hypothetical protein SLEP1_g12633 [Rubroshorea leprosula]